MNVHAVNTRAAVIFERTVLAAIVVNTGVLVWGLFDDEHERMIDALHTGFLLFFVAELLVRFGAAGANPRRFAGQFWNLFDTAVIAVALLPMAGVGVTVLRLARLARLIHGVRHVSHLRLFDLLRRKTRQAA